MPEITLRLHAREQVSLTVAARAERGKGPVGQLRRIAGQVPGILYGHKQEPVAFKTDARLLERILKRMGQSIVFTVDFADGRPPEQAIVRDVQLHKVRGQALHLDLLRIDPTETRVVSVPLHPVGVPEGVRLGGGTLQQTLSHLDLECVISELPASIEIDTSSLQIGDNVHVSDLLAQEPRIVNDPATAIVSVLQPRLTVAEEEGTEGAEGEEAVEPAEGDEQAESESDE